MFGGLWMNFFMQNPVILRTMVCHGDIFNVKDHVFSYVRMMILMCEPKG